MVDVYFLAPDRFRLQDIDGKCRHDVELCWSEVGGEVADGPLCALDLAEGSPARFKALAKVLASDDLTVDVARSINSMIEGAARRSWKLPLAKGDFIEVGSKPVIMGVVNVTPDSFSDGGKCFTFDRAYEQGKLLAEQGADILDIGGESTRPGAQPIDVEEECRRVIPVIEHLATDLEIPISIDTRKSEVAERALAAGASIVNDVTMLTYDPSLAEVAAKGGAALILNHIRGAPENMQMDPRYEDLWPEIAADLAEAVERAVERGVDSDAIVLDPGIGFGKLLEHNLAILKGLHTLAAFGHPVLVGPSRKRFIGDVLDLPPEERLEGTVAACVTALHNGATMFRVHDVLEHRRALDLAWAIHNVELP